MTKKQFLKIVEIVCYTILAGLLTGCVNQNPSMPQNEINKEQIENDRSVRIITTSVAVMEICELLEVDVVGVPQSSLVEIPDCYKNATLVGSPMSPDMEIITSLHPDWVFSPMSLQTDLQPKYEEANLPYAFLNLESIFGMYKSIQDMGVLLHKEEKANQLVQDFQNDYMKIMQRHQGRTQQRVLILMGLPGSYVVATPNSYVGSLVKMVGGINVYEDEEKDFLNINPEDMLLKNPDIILRTSHAMPESVMEMFDKEFQNNDIWKHFDAVKNGKVFDLPNTCCGMSANFHYEEAIELLEKIIY